MRYKNLPPTRRSFLALGECQSSEAWFHWVTCLGSFHNSQTFSTGAFTVASIVTNVFSIVLILLDVFLFVLTIQTYGNYVDTVTGKNDIPAVGLRQAFMLFKNYYIYSSNHEL